MVRAGGLSAGRGRGTWVCSAPERYRGNRYRYFLEVQRKNRKPQAQFETQKSSNEVLDSLGLPLFQPQSRCTKKSMSTANKNFNSWFNPGCPTEFELP